MVVVVVVVIGIRVVVVVEFFVECLNEGVCCDVSVAVVTEVHVFLATLLRIHGFRM